MKEKRDCKIIQDLLPNYIEKLTNEETNKYVEEHLNECSECKQIFENMQKDLKFSNQKRDAREVKYIKKFNKKLKLLRNILIIIVALFIIIVGRKTFIITSLSNKAQKSQDSQNYYMKLESYNSGKMRITEAYYKQEKTLVKINSYSQDEGEINKILYKSGEERFSVIDNGETKIYKKIGDISVRPVAFASEFFLENLFTAITTNISKVELNGNKCYLIRDGNTEKFIDVNTGLAIKIIDNADNITVDYKYEFDNVKDSDVARPDTTGYTIE